MKQAFLKFTNKKFIAAAFLSVFLSSAAISNAAAIKNNIEILSGEHTNIQLTANTSDALVFKVNINNEKADNFMVTIKNNSGDILFSESFKDIDFKKQFKLLKGGQENERYYFTITSKNKNLEDSYVINSAVRIVNDVQINKL